MDLNTGDGVYDYKTKSWWKTYPPRENEGDISIQLSFYTLAFYKLYGVWPQYSQLIFLNRKEGEAVRVPADQNARRTIGQVEVAIEILKDFQSQVKAGRNLPTPNFSCQYCSYASDCPAMPIGGRKINLKAEESEEK